MAAKKQPGRVPGSGKNTKPSKKTVNWDGIKVPTNLNTIWRNTAGAEGPKKSSPRKGR